MEGNVRLVYEGTSAEGLNPDVQIDTDDLDPPRYVDVVVSSETRRQIPASGSDVTVAIPDCCFLMVLSDAETLMRLAAGQAQLKLRTFEVGGADQEVVAIAATSLVFSPNGVSVANVRIVYLGTVP